MPFKEGDYYTSQDLAELNRRLAATGWFNSVVVAPDFAKSRKTKVLPLQGVVSPRKENTVETGVGYSTDARSAGESHVEKTMGQLVWPQPDLQRQPLRLGAAVRLYL